jgi:hypothetical protein
MMGDEKAEETIDDPMLPRWVLFLLRIRGRLLTTFAQLSAASADARYCRNPVFLTPAGVAARRNDIMVSIKYISSFSASEICPLA